ncbi:MAG: hypothetical protein M3Z21_10015, partial [Pseudomonadota bacterium]|nr:hypothetical protein [Pseudomonadota bacterium]
LYGIAGTLPQVRVLNEAGADGHAILLADPLPVFLHYDLTSRTLRLMVGVSVTAEIFQSTLESLAPAADHPMHALEAQVDASHQGFFAWVDVTRTLPLVQFAIPPETALELHKWGLLEARTLALGWGTRNGKGRLKLLLDVPKSGYRQFLPDITSDLSIAAAGAPGVVFALSIPAPQLLQGFEAIAQKEAEPEALQAYLDFKEGFAQLAGLTLEEVLAVFGPESVIFTDQVGEFLALRINHRERLEKLLDTLVQAFGVEYEAREIAGTTYHHLILPSFEPPADAADQDALPAPLAGREKTHFYWIEDNGWLVFAQVPQLLMDRQRQQARTPIKQWLAEQQRLDVGSSLLVFSAAIDDTPRHIYYTYLQLLTYLADLAQEKVDIFALPTATDLNLPKEGAYGVQMDVSGPVLDVEFTFENNPLEIFINQQIIGNIALLGVVAAVALPGYVTDED